MPFFSSEFPQLVDIEALTTDPFGLALLELTNAGELRAAAESLYYVSGTASAITGTTSETTLATIAIPAGAMGPNGKLEIVSLWSYTNSGNTKALRVKIGGTTMQAVNATTTDVARLTTDIWNANSASSQVGMISGSSVAVGVVAGTIATAAVDTASAFNVTLTGQLTNTGETITLRGYSVRVLHGA